MREFEDGQIDGAPRRRRPRRLSAALRPDGPRRRRPGVDRPTSATRWATAASRRCSSSSRRSTCSRCRPPPRPSSACRCSSSRRRWSTAPARLAAALRHGAVRCRAEALPTVMDRLIPRLVQLERMIRRATGRSGAGRATASSASSRFVLAIVVTLADPARQLAAGLLERPARPGAVERDGILFAIGSAVGVVSLPSSPPWSARRRR